MCYFNALNPAKSSCEQNKKKVLKRGSALHSLASKTNAYLGKSHSLMTVSENAHGKQSPPILAKGFTAINTK